MGDWIEHLCMSEVKGKNIRCKNKIVSDCDFCKVHSKNHVYCDKILEGKKILNITELQKEYVKLVINKFDEKLKNKISEMDTKYLHGLIGINNSWGDVQYIYWFKINDIWWDIRTLCKIIAAQLNQTELENPYPIFPENPFTRKKFTISELRALDTQIRTLKRIKIVIDINIALERFLSFTDNQLNTILKQTDQYTAANIIISLLEKKLRFKMINYRDSQGRYCGYWVPVLEPKTNFENCFRFVRTMSILAESNMVTPFYRSKIQELCTFPSDELPL